MHQLCTKVANVDYLPLIKASETVANIDFLPLIKASETVAELESHVEQLKRAVKESEDSRQRQVRDLEHVHKQDKFHIETLHEKQVAGGACGLLHSLYTPDSSLSSFKMTE